MHLRQFERQYFHDMHLVPGLSAFFEKLFAIRRTKQRKIYRTL